MRLKREKYAFMLGSVSYLGHVISNEGLSTGNLKVKAIVDTPDPKDLSELRSFLGMVNYYGKFLPNLATTLAPLYNHRYYRPVTGYGSIVSMLQSTPSVISVELGIKAEEGFSPCQEAAAVQQSSYTF